MGCPAQNKNDAYKFDKKIKVKMEKFITGIQIENLAGTCFTAKNV